MQNYIIEQKRWNPNSIVFGLHPGTVDSKLSKPFQKNGKEYFSPKFWWDKKHKENHVVKLW